MLSFIERLRAIHFDEDKIPEDFIDPVNQELMENPVCLSDGHIYDITTAQELIAHREPKSPLTQAPIERWHTGVVTLKRAAIVEFVEKQEALARPFLALIRQRDEALRNLTEQRDQLNADLVNLRAQNQELENQTKAATKKRKEVEVDNTQLASQLKKSKQQLDESRAAHQDLQARNERLQATHKNLENQVKESQAQLDATKNSGWNLLNYIPSALVSSTPKREPTILPPQSVQAPESNFKKRKPAGK